MAKLKPDKVSAEFISKLSDVSIATRYPEDFEDLIKAYDKKSAKKYLEQARETFKWIKQSLLQ